MSDATTGEYMFSFEDWGDIVDDVIDEGLGENREWLEPGEACLLIWRRNDIGGFHMFKVMDAYDLAAKLELPVDR